MNGRVSLSDVVQSTVAAVGEVGAGGRGDTSGVLHLGGGSGGKGHNSDLK